MLHVALHVVGAFTLSDSDNIFPFGGQTIGCDADTVAFGRANDTGVKAAGAGIPREIPAWRRRSNSLVPSSQSNARSWIVL